MSPDGLTGNDVTAHQVIGTHLANATQNQSHSDLQLDQSHAALQMTSRQQKHAVVPGEGFISTTMVLNNQAPEGAASQEHHGNVVINKTHRTQQVNVVTIKETNVVNQSNLVIKRDSVRLETSPNGAKMAPTQPGQNGAELPLQMEPLQQTSAATYGSSRSHKIATTEHLISPSNRNTKPAASVIETQSDTKIVKKTSDTQNVNINVKHSSKTVVDKTYVVNTNGVSETVDSQSLASFMGRDQTDGRNQVETQNHIQNHADTGTDPSELIAKYM